MPSPRSSRRWPASCRRARPLRSRPLWQASSAEAISRQAERLPARLARAAPARQPQERGLHPEAAGKAQAMEPGPDKGPAVRVQEKELEPVLEVPEAQVVQADQDRDRDPAREDRVKALAAKAQASAMGTVIS